MAGDKAVKNFDSRFEDRILGAEEIQRGIAGLLGGPVIKRKLRIQK